MNAYDDLEFRVFKIVEAQDPEEPFQSHHVVAETPSEALDTFERMIGGDYRAGLDHTPLHIRMMKPEEEVEVGYEIPEVPAHVSEGAGFEIRRPDGERFAVYAKATADQWAEAIGEPDLLSTTAGF